MKARVLSLVVCSIIILGTACNQTNVNQNQNQNQTNQTVSVTQVDLSQNDFTPPIGRAVNAMPASAGERRLMLAYSDDGIHFTADGDILTDQGNVPDAIVEADGTIRVYYVGQGVETGKESTAMAVSQDQGATWSYKLLEFKNFPQPRDPSDPDVVLLEDGTYRMYYTTNINGQQLGIAYADSQDGVTFTHVGTALEFSQNVIDSSTVYFDGVWHMYVLRGTDPVQLHATSSDGTVFTVTPDPVVTLPQPGYIFSNPLIERNQLRMFAFHLGEKNIRSFTTGDTETWTASDVAVQSDSYIQDSTVVQLSNGSYLMVYVSEIPE